MPPSAICYFLLFKMNASGEGLADTVGLLLILGIAGDGEDHIGPVLKEAEARGLIIPVLGVIMIAEAIAGLAVSLDVVVTVHHR